MMGHVTLVGAGPGDPGLLTLKGKKAIEQADVVVFDRLVSPEILALIPPTAKVIDVGKRVNVHPVPQEEINQILLREALGGANVVRLKGGDPFLFGRGGEELELLAQHQVPFQVVPGVTSALAVPAYGGIPVTHRDCCSSLHIVTGHQRAGKELDIDFDALVATRGTLVFLMGVSALPQICEGLLKAGMDPFEALKAITINPAKHLGVEDRVGSLEPGKDADLVLVDGDPMVSDSHIRCVWINGEKVVG